MEGSSSNDLLLSHDNHVFIFTSSGKPVFTRYGTMHEIADLFALLLVFMNMSEERHNSCLDNNKCKNDESVKSNNNNNNNNDTDHSSNIIISNKSDSSSCKDALLPHNTQGHLLTCASFDVNGRVLTFYFYHVQHMYYVLTTASSCDEDENKLTSVAQVNESNVEENTCIRKHCTHRLCQPERLLRQLHRFLLSIVPNIHDILSSSPSFDLSTLISSTDVQNIQSIIICYEYFNGVLSWSSLLPDSVYVARSVALQPAIRSELEKIIFSSCTETLTEQNVKSSWFASLNFLTPKSELQSPEEFFTNSYLPASTSPTSGKLDASSKAYSNYDKILKEEESTSFAEEAANHLFTFLLYNDALLTAVSTSPLAGSSYVANYTKYRTKEVYNANNRANYNCNAAFVTSVCSELREAPETPLRETSSSSHKGKQGLPCVLSCDDAHLLFHFARNVCHSSVRETWFPLCLPDFNETGFVWVYVANLTEILSESQHKAATCNENNALSSASICQERITLPVTRETNEQSNTKITNEERHSNEICTKETLLLVQVTASNTSFNCCASLTSHVVNKLMKKGERWVNLLLSTLTTNYRNEECAQTISHVYCKVNNNQNFLDETNPCQAIPSLLLSNVNEVHKTEEEQNNTNVQEKENALDIKNESLTQRKNNLLHFFDSHTCNLCYFAFVSNSHFIHKGQLHYFTVPCINSHSNISLTIKANTNSDIAPSVGGSIVNSDNMIELMINSYRKHAADVYRSPFVLIREEDYTYLLYLPVQRVIQLLLNEFCTQTSSVSLASGHSSLFKHIQSHKSYSAEFALRCETLMQAAFFAFNKSNMANEMMMMIQCSLECLHEVISTIDSTTVRQFLLHEQH